MLAVLTELTLLGYSTRYAAKKIETRYYNPDLHYASFLLPTQARSGRRSKRS